MGEFSGRDIKKKRKKYRWLKKPWRRKAEGLKAKYDPANLFRRNQNIRPGG